MACLQAPSLPSCITHSEPREMLVIFVAMVSIDGISFLSFLRGCFTAPTLPLTLLICLHVLPYYH